MADKLPQTHRTILFEEFAPDSPKRDLFTVLSSHKSGIISDQELDSFIEGLEVHSFEEFLKNFSPKVYEYTMDFGGVPSVKYTTDYRLALQFDGKPIDLTSQTYYQMLVNMYVVRGESGVANIEFDDAKIREILTPKREIEELYDKRSQFAMLMDLNEERQRKHESNAPIVKRMKELRREALKQFKSPTTLLSMGISDLETKIQLIDEKLKQIGAPTSDKPDTKRPFRGRFAIADNGEIILIPAKSSAPDDVKNDSPSDPEGDKMKLLAGIIQNDIEKKFQDDVTSREKALVVSAYTGVDIQAKNSLENMNRAEIVEYRAGLADRKNTYENLFRDTKESFVKSLSEVIRKILSVKIFFDHATVKGADLPEAGLIIANCKPRKLLDDKVKDVFTERMNHYGKNEVNKKIWFAIIPNITDDIFGGNSSGNIGGGGDIDEDLDDEEESNDEQTNSDEKLDFENAKLLLNILEESHILTTFNFTPTEETTFSNISPKTITYIQKKLAALGNNKEHLVYAMPNFTIMKEGYVPINPKEKNSPQISVPAIYIDAAYVAAGLLVASQQTDFWFSKGFKDGENFLRVNDCVRIDLESDEVTRVLLTKFNRERSIAWSENVINAFTKNRFGFVFDGDKKTDSVTGNDVSHTYILNARTLKTKEEIYQPIFRTLLKDCINVYLKKISGSQTKESDIENFVSKFVNTWKQQRERYKNKNIINFILRANENISNEGKGKLKVEFADGDDFVTIEIIEG